MFLNNSSNQANNLNDVNTNGTNQLNNFNFSNDLATSGNLESTNENSNGENQTDLNINQTLFNQDEDCKSNVFMQNQSSLTSNIDSNSDSSNSNNNLQCNNLNSSLGNMINFCSPSCASPFNPMNNVMFTNNNNLFVNSPLPSNLDSQRVREWLLANRFEKYFSPLHMYNSNDLLNLSREDLIQICGLSDGIRLYNCLHTKVNQPKTIIYLSLSFDTALFRAIYLSSFKYDEFREKLLRLVCDNNNNYNYNVLSSKLNNILMIGPKKDIRILVTEEMISNLEKESMYVLRIEQGKFIVYQIEFDLILINKLLF